jgi:hypothetical protein
MNLIDIMTVVNIFISVHSFIKFTRMYWVVELYLHKTALNKHIL